MAELEVGREEQSLRHGDVTPGLEHHHRNRTTGECVTNDKLGNDIETDLLVGHGLDDSDRQDIKECDALSYASASGLHADSEQLTSARTNAQTGIWVCHTSIVTTPNTNMATRPPSTEAWDEYRKHTDQR